MHSRDYLRLAPQETINSALGIDAAALSSKPELFINRNRIGYDLAINTWLLAIRDFAPYSWPSVATRIQRDGLAATVGYFSSAASKFLIDDLDIQTAPLAYHMYLEIQRSFSMRSIQKVDYAVTDTPEGIFLFLCRYLKRFTPLNADKLDSEAIASFLSNQNRLKMIDRRGRSEFIINLIRDEIDYALLNARTKAYSSIIMADIEITPGTCYSMDGKGLRTLQEKYESLIHDFQYDSIDVWRRSVWSFNLGCTARLTTVPKTFSSARTIAPEECLRQAVAHRMFSLRQWELPGINLQDQSVNQHFAKEGSITGTWCTIDLSHASDDVSWTLVQDIYRYAPYYLHFLGRIRPSEIVVNQKRYPLYSFATMGNSMTFLVESEVFWLITKAAVHFAQRCGVMCSDAVVVYGDDIICASEAYPFVEAFLTTLGFSVNIGKSFAEGRFRESCGKDYLAGQDVSSPYFPRRPLESMLTWFRNRNSELTTVGESLISLQHRLYQVSPISSQYLELYIRECKSDLGMEPVGTLSTDLWGLDSLYVKERYIPEWQPMTDSRVWIFQNGRWTYDLNRHKFLRTVIKDEAHKVTYQLRPVVEVESGVIPDSILYLQYLAKGPVYASLLDASLGISTSRRSLPAGRPSSAWKLIER
jgi:hypothetical protein